jgi:hypothetical protein
MSMRAPRDRSWIVLITALAAAGCKGDRKAKAAVDPAAGAVPATAPVPTGSPPTTAPPSPTTVTPPATTTPPTAAPLTAVPATPGSAAAMPASVAGCTPVAPHQRAGKATITAVGDGVDVRDVVAPAICGALHIEATRRFAVGDGTQFKACLPGGQTFSISADVALTGPQKLTFTYEDYKKKSALVELAVAGKGTYNQRDEPTERDTLTIAYDWATAEAHVDVVWPSKRDRVVRVDALFDCGGPLR